MIKAEQQGPGNSIRVLRMAHGKANVQDLEFCEAMNASVRAAEADASVTAIVIAASGNIFSAGVDLKRLIDGRSEYASAFLPALRGMFEAVFNCSKPVVAAVNGSAIAGGCVLACAADYRLMSPGGKIGIPELLVGVPFPTVATEIMRNVTAPLQLHDLIHKGSLLDAEKAQEYGLINQVCQNENLIDTAVAEAERLASLPPKAFALTKQQMRGPTLHWLQTMGADLDADACSQWESEETRDRIRQYMERTFGKKK